MIEAERMCDRRTAILSLMMERIVDRSHRWERLTEPVTSRPGRCDARLW